MQLFPSSHDFVADFSAAATNVRETAGVVVALFAGEQPVAESARLLRALEHRGDALTHATLTALSHSFAPAISPRAVRAVALGLDDVVDALEEAGQRAALYQLDLPLPSARELARIAQAQADVLVELMTVLPSAEPAEVLLLLMELHRLENEADDVLSAALATLYDGVTDVPGVIQARQRGELYELLEEATDRVERVAHTVEDIVSQR